MQSERREKKQQKHDVENGKGNGKGKGTVLFEDAERREEIVEKTKEMALVVFACRHVVHRTCLEVELGKDHEDRQGYVCPVCAE